LDIDDYLGESEVSSSPKQSEIDLPEEVKNQLQDMLCHFFIRRQTCINMAGQRTQTGTDTGTS
jgi:cation transport regulator ChaB